MNKIYPSLVAIVPAAGVGSRMKADRPKQYLTLDGRFILDITIEKLLSCALVSQVIVAVSADDPYFSQLSMANHPKVLRVDGGVERADSVLNGLNKALALGAQWALVHDAARPCLLVDDIERLLEQVAADDDGGLLAAPVRDTMKRASPDGFVDHTVNREGLWHALTPQLFPTKSLQRNVAAALAASIPVTDEASAMEWAGHHPKLVLGNDTNIKVTRPADLKLAGFYLQHEDNLGCA
ncbi:2-C-methyl-D-erythritol 4-phosphate cytidylyltransferase [Corallincola spongiicola]|uniref:2-C-methyl-D-erythritol 4-phosphate cytidylyltransferase n=1 Tax=Corallincola spongiicola TaxID=2520508 RepID=A0ABY1WRK3_9GAMM|nr:2-C-methyl-D-erythritol 4-phosphate cytidylyltransferase [Corallincola spongiicola]TAA47361.1 2-C-methyl-D-erythritol 4-phosphate cytidylyltransferase [Corallincola spongiicola]